MSLLSPTPFESARAVFPINRSIRHVERAAKQAAHKGGSPWKRSDLLLFALLVGAQFRCKLLLIKDKRVKGIEPSCRAWEARVLPLNYTRVGKIS
ncbi:MAG: hypothetical protein QOG92_2178 [Verrucomicrobiota bacterium]|jgi:hypothetical protein|nr:hypothetical protein [Verrucomicrobiota bacterium]